MASLQERNGSYRVQFFFRGKLHGFTIGKVSVSEAEAKAAQVDYLLMRLKQKLLTLPPDTDIVTFVQHDGTPPSSATPAAQLSPRQPITLIHLKDAYLTTHGNGTLEASSLATCGIHLTHLCRVLGDAFPLAELTLADLQGYINKRTTAKIAPVTVRKEVTTFRSAWNWGTTMGLTTDSFPTKGLRYPKIDEKTAFMTLAELKKELASGGDPETLWESVYLTAPELAALLDWVKEKGSHPWIYPLFCFTAHTGARRSELLRVMVSDVDFDRNAVTIHEKKRSRGKRTSRRVPLTPFLRDVLREWLAVHPGGPALFCQAGTVARSKKRSATTGHRGEKTRASSLKGRIAAVRRRENPLPGALTPNEIHDHFRRVLRGSE